MGSYTVQSIVDKVEERLEDENNDRWSVSEHVVNYNMAIEAVCRYKTDAYTLRENVQLTVGSTQSLPARRHKLIRPLRNMGSTGNASGAAIRFASFDVMNDFNTNWHNADNGTSVDEVLYDENHPLEFWVYPPAANYYIELIMAGIPPEATISDTLALPDIYRTPIIYFMMGYAHQSNRSDADFAKGGSYMQMAIAELGVQAMSEAES